MTRQRQPEGGTETPRGGVSRRDFIRKAGAVAGTVAWVAPVIQSMAPPAYAHAISPVNFTCCMCHAGTPGTTFCGGPGVTGFNPAKIDAPESATPAACSNYCATLPGGAGGPRAYCWHGGPGAFTNTTGGCRTVDETNFPHDPYTP